jgi:ribonuclease III
MLELLERVKQEALEKDARSRLQEFSQLTYNITPSYRKVSAMGPDHDKEFLVEVIINNNIVGQGIGKSKRSASQAAAADALVKLLAAPELVVMTDAEAPETSETEPNPDTA